jgi:ribosomal protein S19
MFFSSNQINSVIIGYNYLYRIEKYVKKIKKVCRNEKVTKFFVGRVVKIHNGKFSKNFIVRKNSLNQMYGALFNTKKLGSQIHVKKKANKKLLKKKLK